MSDDPVLAQIRELLESARREAYERGYNDAVRRIMAAASATPATEADVATIEAKPTGEGLEGKRMRARRGSLETRLVEILSLAPEGLTVAEIESLGASDPEPLKRPSIHATLQRLQAARRVERESRRWRLLTMAEKDDESSAAPDSPTSDQAFVAPDTSPETM